MVPSLIERRPKVAVVAAKAGVSVATVDRVINGRGGVHPSTARRVETAIREIVGSRTVKPPGPRRQRRFSVLLAGDGSQVTRTLADALLREGTDVGASVSVTFVERMNPSALAGQLRACLSGGCDGVAAQVLDHVLVREAMAELAEVGIPFVTVLTDMASADRMSYVGLDNRAAGRTAGFLMSRFSRGPGHLAVVWGGELYRSHEERESGFRSVLRYERPDLTCLEVITDNDDAAVARSRIRELIATHGDLSGIYCVGGGITGVAEALEHAPCDRRIVTIGHNFNSQTKPYLLAGTIDALIHQDTATIARGVLHALVSPKPPPTVGVPIEIITRENVAHR